MSFLDEAIYEREERENSIERQLFGGGGDDDDDNEKENDDDKKDGTKVEPKTVKRRISKQPRLNPEKLMGPRGIKAIPVEFKDIKLKGKGHEVSDLDLIMGRLAHWAHRLYPKYNFDDCIQAIETQGKKKILGNYMRNFRQGMLDDDDEVVRNSDDEEGAAAAPQNMPEMMVFDDDMDRMLSEEINKTSFHRTHESHDDEDLGVRALDSTMESQFSVIAPRASSTLTAEQIQKIEENKRQAMERLKQRKTEMGVSPKTTLTDEQRQMIEENKRRAMERLKQKKQQAMQNVMNMAPIVEEAKEPESPAVEADTPVVAQIPHEDEEMEPLVYDSD